MNAQAEQMKRVVGELVALVGGKTSSPENGGAMEDYQPRTRTRNFLAGANGKSSSVETSMNDRNRIEPDQVIPMDEEDFKDF
jgi:methyl-accepting chemotaxis protein